MSLIQFNDTDFEENIYDIYTFLNYKGKAFTGTLLYDNQIISYKNGHAHGRVLSYYYDDCLASDSIFENGRYQSGKEWYIDGQLKTEISERGIFSWDTDGLLAQKNGNWLYKSGNIKLKHTTKNCEYFNDNQEVAIQVTYINNGDYRNQVKYYDAILIACYENLLINLYPTLDTLFYNTLWYFWGWVWRTYANDKHKTLAILQNLTQHQNEEVRLKAKQLLKTMPAIKDANQAWQKHTGYHIIP